MPKRTTRDYSAEHANQYVEDAELRKIVDSHIQGMSASAIAQVVGRKPKSVEKILRKVSLNYDEDGKRKNLIHERLRAAPSSLEFAREGHEGKSERSFFRRCYRKGRTLADMVVIFQVPAREILEMEKDIIGGWEFNRYLAKEYNNQRSIGKNAETSVKKKS
jgi:hypothetical protein